MDIRFTFHEELLFKKKMRELKKDKVKYYVTTDYINEQWIVKFY